MKKKYATLIGAGQIGTFTSRYLEMQGFHIHAGDIEPDPGFFHRFGPSQESAMLSPLDVRDPAAVEQFLNQGPPSEVVVLAVGISGAQSMKNPVAAREIYDGGTQNVLKAAKKSKVGRVVLLSSLAVYGVSGSKSLISESDPLRPPTEYGKILLEAERTAQRLCDGAPPLLILRSAGVFGPNRMGMGSHSARFFERLLYSASLQNPIQLIGSWKDSDDYIYVKDVGRGIALAAKVPLHEPVTVLNLGTGRATTLREVVNILRTMFPTCQISADRMENAPPSRRKPLDCQRIRLFLGFKPEFSMPAALDDYAAEVDLQRKDPCASQQAK